jgi:hypothetical protein
MDGSRPDVAAELVATEEMGGRRPLELVKDVPVPMVLDSVEL